MIVLDSAQTPQSIEDRSFSIIDDEVPQPRPYVGALWEIARRMIHTTGDVSLIDDICLSEKAMHAGIQALRAGCTIFTDTEMARCGMVMRRLAPLGVRVQCILQGEGVQEYAAAQQCTRSKAGIWHIKEQLAENILAIGNAPTALLAVLELLDTQNSDCNITPPALIVGMPVGFVNASESKELLAQSEYVHMTVRGRKGGSPLVASVINALAILAGK